MSKLKTILWFRQDLRLQDNPALTTACQSGSVVPVFILDDADAQKWSLGSASKCWLYHSLKRLSESLNGRLIILRGDAHKQLISLATQLNATAVFWNRCYEPWRVKRDTLIKQSLSQSGIIVRSYNGSLLWEPSQVQKADGTPYKVFTPFYRKGCLAAPAPRPPIARPAEIPYSNDAYDGLQLGNLELLPSQQWHKDMIRYWTPGEAGAHQRLHEFLERGLNGYREGRNFPTRLNVSRLSPHLHFGEISPNQVWYSAIGRDQESPVTTDLDCFQSELGWREFSHHLLFHNPDLPTKNLQPKFDRFPWKENTDHLHAWQRGRTGYPIVDAGMRELWQTGYMHNRVRMIVGSFLVKNLMIDWRQGEQWFWDCLVDADLANNSASWQWIGGCGADAAPYFRIFNPITQGQKFDPDGRYVRQYVPEIAALPDKFIHAPWQAPSELLHHCKVELDRDYPRPVVDLKPSREAALAAFKSLSNPSPD